MTTPNTDALLPCPMCGGNVALVRYGEEEDIAAMTEAFDGVPPTPYWMFSHNCGGIDMTVYTLCEDPKYSFQKSKSDFITAWNTRTPAPSVTSEELAVALCVAQGQDPHQLCYHTNDGIQEPWGDLWMHYIPQAQAILTAFHVTKKGNDNE